MTAAPAVLYASAWLTHCRWARTQPLKELPPPGQPFKDKFLVQACQTTAATDDVKAIFESTDKDAIVNQKVLCTFNSPGVDTSAHEPNDSAANATGRPYAVQISGVTGQHAASVNGVYRMVAGEACGGRPVYKKEGGNVWIEYWSGSRQWQVKPEASRGENRAWMFSHVGTEAGAVEEVTGGWEVEMDVSVQAGVRVVRAETGSRMSVGDMVKVTDSYADLGDAQNGPLIPGASRVQSLS